VVPALAEDQEGDEPVVARLVAREVVPAAEHVADRVHTKGGVLVEEDADEAAPEQRLEPALPRSSDRVAEREREPEGRTDPEHVEAVDRADEPVLVEVLAVDP